MLKQELRAYVTVGLLSLLFSGCVTLEKLARNPRYDQVLVYDRPYDYTYLRTLEALNNVPNWVLDETDKEKGLIVIRNTQYGHLFDRDKQEARVAVRHIGRTQTSVSLDPSSQQIKQGGELLEAIDRMVKLVPKKEELPQAQAGD